jgi:hypothetical protein
LQIHDDEPVLTAEEFLAEDGDPGVPFGDQVVTKALQMHTPYVRELPLDARKIEILVGDSSSAARPEPGDAVPARIVVVQDYDLQRFGKLGRARWQVEMIIVIPMHADSADLRPGDLRRWFIGAGPGHRRSEEGEGEHREKVPCPS